MKYQPECPIPPLDFDVITLGHGSGGLLTNRLLDSGVFSTFNNKFLNERHDGAVLDIHGKAVFSTDSFVVSPIFFPGGNIGDLAVNGTVNDIAMCGGVPKYLSLSFILEEGLKMEEFRQVLWGIQKAAVQANVQIVTGDTKVVEKGKGDKIFINTTGIGELHTKANIQVRNIEVGDKIIISGELAHHGMAIMSVREGLGFETQIVSDTAPLNGVIQNLLDEFGSGIHLMRDPTRGGLATVLAEIAMKAQIGIRIDEKSLPQNEEISSACELLGLDPMYVANEGLFIALVKPDIANSFVDQLRKSDIGKHATEIGKVVKEHSKQAVLHNSIGGKRVIHMLPGEQLPRIC